MVAQTTENTVGEAASSRPTQVVDVELWLDRATEPSQVRAFTPGTAAYVGKHRKEPDES